MEEVVWGGGGPQRCCQHTGAEGVLQHPPGRFKVPDVIRIVFRVPKDAIEKVQHATWQQYSMASRHSREKQSTFLQVSF